MSTSGVLTEVDRESVKPARRVKWIGWDSGFRDSGLRVGDRIAGDGGETYTAEEVAKGETIGGPDEGRRWRRLGLDTGSTLAVEAERGGETVRLEGRLLGNRTYRDAEGRRSFGEDGPAHGEKDGFEYAWSPWYSQFQDFAQAVLGGWDYVSGFDSRRYAERLEPFRERVVSLKEKYPGAFARAARHDFDEMARILAGERTELSAADLEYRQLGELRAARVTAAADAAWAAFQAEMGDELLRDPFPVPDPFEEDISAFAGRVVELPEIGDRNLLYETTKSWYHVGGPQGSYLIDRRCEEMRGLYLASARYVEKVDPFLFDKRRLTFVGRVKEEPVLVVDAVKNVTVVGLEVRPLAVLVRAEASSQGRFFADLRNAAGPDSDNTFAGEAELLGVGRPQLAADLDPAGVLNVFFHCLKAGDMETWKQCFADWKVRTWFGRNSGGTETSTLWVDRTWITLNDRDAVSVWDQSRKRLLDDVYGVQVARVSEPRVVYDAAGQPPDTVDEDDPRIVEEVRAVVDHIGKFGEEFRTFAGNGLHRRWTLQRLDGGPWRIIDGQPV